MTISRGLGLTPREEEALVGRETPFVPVGWRALGAWTMGETAEAGIRVTDRESASGSRSLAFVDAPGLDAAWNPHLVYLPDIPSGVVRARFSLRREAGAVILHEWRDARQPYSVGPSLLIGDDGALLADGTRLAEVPLDTWTRFEIVFEVGPFADGGYEVAITLSDGEPQVFSIPPDATRTLCGLEWFGLVAFAESQALFFLDDLSLEVQDPPRPPRPSAGRVTYTAR